VAIKQKKTFACLTKKDHMLQELFFCYYFGCVCGCTGYALANLDLFLYDLSESAPKPTEIEMTAPIPLLSDWILL